MQCVWLHRREKTCSRLATKGFILWREAVLLNMVSCIKTECGELVAVIKGEEKKYLQVHT